VSAQLAGSTKLSRDLRDAPLERYRITEQHRPENPRRGWRPDGRKWKVIARDRMSLAIWLSTFGDGDGRRIFPSIYRMVVHFKWSRSKLFILLDDLKVLCLLVDEGLLCERGPRRRRMDVPAFIGAEVHDSAEVADPSPPSSKNQDTPDQGAEVHDSAEPKSMIRAEVHDSAEPKSMIRAEVHDSAEPKSMIRGAEVHDSGAEVHSNDGHYRHLTDTNQNQNLRPLTRPNSTAPCGKLKNKKPASPQQRNFGIVRRLIPGAVEILETNTSVSYPDAAADLKQWASDHYLPIDTLPGTASPIQQAIDIAIEKQRCTAALVQISAPLPTERASALAAPRADAGSEPDDGRGREAFFREVRRIASMGSK
jgi:hypothetical protein